MNEERKRSTKNNLNSKQKKGFILIIGVVILILASVLIVNGINSKSINEKTQQVEQLQKTNQELEERLKKVEEELDFERNANVVYLSFDDGPSHNTTAILDALDRHGVKATFFVTGQNSDYFPLFNDIIQRGHSLGLHTNTHVYKDVYANFDNFKLDFTTLENTVMSITGIQPQVYRFPGGSAEAYRHNLLQPIEGFLQEKNYAYFDWNVDSNDWRVRNGKQAAEYILANIGDQKYSHILLHDLYDFNVETIDTVVPQLKERGYVFRTYKNTSPTIHFFE